MREMALQAPMSEKEEQGLLCSPQREDHGVPFLIYTRKHTKAKKKKKGFPLPQCKICIYHNMQTLFLKAKRKPSHLTALLAIR